MKSRAGRSVITSISELDHLREVARGVSLDFVQLGSGTLRGVIGRADLGPSAIYTNQFDLPLRARGDTSAKELTFVVLDSDSQGVLNGERFSAEKILLYRPGADLDGTAVTPFLDWPISVDPAELRRFVFDLSGREMALPKASCTALHPSPAVVDELRTFVLTVLAIAADTPAALDYDRVRKSLHDELLSRLAAVVTNEQRETSPEPRWVGSRSALVRRAEEFILSHMADGICMADICADADVSERLLRLAFHQIMGFGPKTYLKVRRLHCVRAELERRDARAVSVSTAALRWGFWEFGRFARDYVRLFGEKPSDTRRRATAE